METRRRSIVKALSWRVFATLITTAIAYGMTGELTFAMQIGLIDTVVKLAVYFAHERLWLRIPYGKVRGPEYQI